MCRSVLGVGLALALLSSAAAKQIDLSNRSDPDGIFEVGFCARPSPVSSKGWPGHAFVSFSHKKPNGDRDFTAIGHTLAPSSIPVDAVWSLFGAPISGMLKEELYTSALQD
jgi:hypothetical protein